MASKSKGNRTRLKGIKILQGQGYDVEVVEKVGRFYKRKDLFDLWDVIAIKRFETLLIQFKSNTKPNLEPFNQFQQKYPQFRCQVWINYDYQKDFVILECG